VYYHAGRAANQLLGNSILCYMKELIQAKASYENYTVPSQAEGATDNGENTLATMPSVIVEVGFHTNPSDAAALQDSVFRTAAMKGVEKGYRLHAAGETGCMPFKITSVPNRTTPHGTSIPVQHHYEGHPQFPVKRVSEVVSCGTTTCNTVEATFNSGSSPLITTAYCGASTSQSTFVHRYRVTLTDADGVKTAPVEYTLTCTPSTGLADDASVSMQRTTSNAASG